DEPVESAALAPRRALAACQRKIKARIIAGLCHRNTAAATHAELSLCDTGCRQARNTSGRQDGGQDELTHECLVAVARAPSQSRGIAIRFICAAINNDQAS